MVEKANHVAAQRFWRTLPDDVTVEQAQTALDEWCRRRGDLRLRAGGTHGKLTVATLADREPLRAVGPAYPAQLTVNRIATAQALVAYRGNFYSVPPELAGAAVTVTHRLGAESIDIATRTSTGPAVVLARHQLAPDGAGAIVRTDAHVTALNTAALTAASPARPHRRKQRIPPGPAARAAAAALSDTDTDTAATAVVIDLTRYAAAAAGRNTLQ